MAKPGSPIYRDVPLSMYGGTDFGRYAKQSAEQAFNMICLSGGWMAPFAGYKRSILVNQSGTGRNIYASSIQNKMFAVIDQYLYVIDSYLGFNRAIGQFDTSTTDIYIAEDSYGRVFFADGQNLYYWRPDTNAITKESFAAGTNGWTADNKPAPGYLTFQNGRIIFADTRSNFWYLSGIGQGVTGTTYFANTSQTQGALQTKPNHAQACIRFPGKGNLILVFGKTVIEQWQDVGTQLFPYQRSQSTNIDYGCINPATIDENENIVCWVAGNEKSGPFIAYTDGAGIKKISNDGIDYKLANLTNPSKCYGYLFRQDGHLIYVASWPDDGVCYAYDFNIDKFYTLTDQNMKSYIAKKVCYFNGKYYFVSIVDGNVYEMGSNLYSYDYGDGRNFEIPRTRIPPSIFLPDQSIFVAGYSGFTIEQGQFDYDYRDTTFILGEQFKNTIGTEKVTPSEQAIGGGHNYRRYIPRVDLSLSKDGNVNFGTDVSIAIHPQGNRQNKMIWRGLGKANYLTQRFTFWGFGPFTFADGITGVRQ